ncbi:MAG: methyltransferase domain-containing protein [Candidatus Omnitrophica bacterium]|nr:methyltransferase domain-containing protein [Candidatus Omnitrophota bacterium]MCB9769325.1 methyltransferase domain-containing protein [Candidatus Omnitrophota bacterium]MCB9783893.1 methyltransferase domain-containing protein [Candidatus Omnitrophota bacterium]
MTNPNWVFLQEFIQSFHTTGAIAPSGRALARRMVAPLDRLSGPRRILEAGPGTGVFSSEVVSRLGPEDEFILCEINPKFAELLRSRLNSDPAWNEKADRIRIECGDVRDLFAAGSFDLVVSGLPLNNFTPSFVEELLGGFVESLSTRGVHTFFEYQAVRNLRRRLGSRKNRERMEAIHRLVQSLSEKARVDCERIFLNLPPAIVYEISPNTNSN